MTAAAALAPRTVVEAYLPPTGSVPAALLYKTADRAGIDDQPLRLCLRRMVASGTIEVNGRGRAAHVTLTAAGRRELEHDRLGLALALAQDAGLAPWDERWRLFAVSVPERRRPLRDSVRRDLLAVGAAAISTGLYVSPHVLDDVVVPEARAHLSTATTTDLDVRGVHAPREIAELLWPAAPVVAGYGVLEQALAADVADSAVPSAVHRLRLADALERAMREDPLLPRELRGRAWEPEHLRLRWRERWISMPEDGWPQPYDGWLSGPG